MDLHRAIVEGALLESTNEILVACEENGIIYPVLCGEHELHVRKPLKEGWSAWYEKLTEI